MRSDKEILEAAMRAVKAGVIQPKEGQTFVTSDLVAAGVISEGEAVRLNNCVEAVRNSEELN